MKRMLILLFAMCLFSKAMYGQITWNTPVTLSTATVNASDPQVVIDSSGNVMAVWVESSLIKASYQPFGGSFGAAVTLSNISNTSSSPRAGVDSSGNVTAIWIENGTVSSATFSSGSWSAETTVSGAETGASAPQLFVDSTGNAVAIWVNSGFIESATKPFGGSWSSVSQLSTTGVEDVPQVAIGAGGRVVAVWHSTTGGIDNVYFSTNVISGTWSTAAPILSTTPAFHFNYPHVAVDPNGNAIGIAFRYSVAGSVYTNVQLASSTLAAGSSTWSNIPSILSNSGQVNPANLNSSVVLDVNGNALALWINSYDGENFTLESAAKPVGQSWTFSTLAQIPSLYAFQTDMQINGLGEALAVYMFWDGFSNVIIEGQESNVSANPNSVNQWTFPVTISQGSENGYPRCAYTLSGTMAYAATAYISNIGGFNTIQASTGSKMVVAPPTSLSVTQSPTSFGIFTDYTNTLSWTASTSPNIQEYNIYRNGVYVTSVDQFTFSFLDHNQLQGGPVTYSVAAVDSTPSQSAMAGVSFP